MYSKDIKDIVKKFRFNGRSYGWISNELGIAKSSLFFMENCRKSYMKKKPGPKPLIDKRISMKMKRLIECNNNLGMKVNCNIIKQELQLPVSRKTINNWCLKNEFKYRKQAQSIVLSAEHKSKRIEAISMWISEGINFKNAVFSDEKIFSLDGPDNW